MSSEQTLGESRSVPLEVDQSNKENQVLRERESVNQVPLSKVQQIKKKALKPLSVSEALSVQKQKIDFGTIYPGSICEDDILVVPKLSEPLVINIQVFCEQPEYDDLDEYVYSARKLTSYDYNDKLMVLVNNRTAGQFKVAIKVPNIRNPTIITGVVQITVMSVHNSQLAGSIVIPLRSQIVIPNIQCLRALLQGTNNPVICVAAKNNKQSDCKVPMKNLTAQPLSFDCDFLVKEDMPFNMVSTNNVAAQAGAPFMVLFSIRPKGKLECGEYKQVLILKVKNSSVFFSYPMLIKIF